MTDVSLDLIAATFAKTAIGQQEIQTRSLGLPLLVRRLLVLVDGRRSGKELAAFVPDQDVSALLSQLLVQGCIDAKAPEEIGSVTAESMQATAPGSDTTLLGLPQAETRSPKEIEMARNFMTNTVNTVFGMNLRLSTIEAIFACQTANDLRRVYPLWVATMNSSGVGARRLPELRQKLLQVL